MRYEYNNQYSHHSPIARILYNYNIVIEHSEANTLWEHIASVFWHPQRLSGSRAVARYVLHG